MILIDQTYTIKAPIDEVWRALTDASVIEKWGAGPAKRDPKEGGSFSVWDGDIHGTNAQVIPHKLLRQEWYGHDKSDNGRSPNSRPKTHQRLHR